MDNFNNENNNESNVEQNSASTIETQKPQYYSGGQFKDEKGNAKGTSKTSSKKLPTWAKALLIIAAIILFVVLLTVSCNKTVDKFTGEIYGSSSSNEVIADFGYDYIGVIHVEGEIAETTSGQYNHEYLLNAIDAMMNDTDNKGIIMYVDTPGGSVFASDELYLKIKEYQDTTKRPVYSSMQSMAASGGYYISAPCDKIIANRNCWTGSIGVTMGTMVDVSELLDNLGIKTETITSGANKAMGSYYEPMTAEQREIFQSLIDDAYEQFTGIVAEGRKMDISEVKKLADGRIYTANQALANGLIDEIGTFEEAIEDMKEAYDLGDCSVEDFQSETPTDLYSLLGLATEVKGNGTFTDADAINELIDLNGTFKLSYLSNIRK